MKKRTIRYGVRIFLFPLYHFLKNSVAAGYRILLFILLRWKPQYMGTPSEKTNRFICLAHTGDIGDFIIFTSLIRSVRNQHPGAKITLIVSIKVKNLAETCPYTDHIIYFEESKYRWNILFRCRFLRQLQCAEFDIAVNGFYSRGILLDEIILLSGAKEKIAFRGENIYLTSPFWQLHNRFYDRLVVTGAPLEIDRYREMAAVLGAGPEMAMKTEVWPAIEDEREANNVISTIIPDNKNIIVIAPCASEDLRKWEREKFITLCKMFQPGKFVFLFSGNMREKEYIGSIAEQVNGLNCAGISLRVTFLLMKRASLFIGNETGLLHLSLTAGTPSAAIVGGAYWKRFLPYGNGPVEVVTNMMECFGCYRNCRYDKPYCIASIQPKEVYSRAVEIMRFNN